METNEDNVLDNYKEHELHDEYDKNCSTCYSNLKCKICHDTGVVIKTEWIGDDQSYDIEKKCICQEEIDWNYYKLSTLI